LTVALRLAALALACSFAAGSLAAQDARLSERLAPGPRLAVQRMVDSAAALGLPTEPLVRKALEGESKGADSGRIVAAVSTLFGHLRTARRLVGPDAEESELVAGAAALRAGAPPARLADLAALRPRARLAVPLSVLADLLASGIPSEEAWTSVYQMATRGAPDAAFLSLRNRLTGADSRRPPSLPPAAERPPAAPLPGPEPAP
jgi:hypothetical protein